MKLIFLDTEATGADLKKDRLSQVSYLIDETIRTEYFKPPVPMSIKAMAITHITNKMLEDKPPFKGSDMEKELSTILKDNILVAHNVAFDAGMLETEGVEVGKTICTLRVARHMDVDAIIPEYNLQYLRYYLELDIEGGAHDAEMDVRVLKGVFDRLFDKMRTDKESDEEVIEEMIDISSKPSLIKVFKFGKYIGRKLKEVAAMDPDYLDWLLKQKMEDPNRNEDWIYTLEHYLGYN